MSGFKVFKLSSFLLSIAIASSAFALSLSDLSNRDAASGLKAALETGSLAAVSKLGIEDGFLKNDKVRITLPDMLERAKPLLKITGHGKRLDELEVAMNRAAESAIPMAKPLLLDAVKSMSVADAKRILTGGETSVTDFFREKTTAPLAVKFLPLVKAVTDRSGLATRYNAAMAQVSSLNLVPEQQATVEAYVTQRALDGLFYMIGEEEKAIRRDPIGTGSKIIGKVFGSLN
ncbi:DUF4197 domain-containing protein [Noviherbaspirillum massiliense]|uniref:DUF4197 domain-containing protein n=1 Tax=Noviherbaspirillum massiliense TaxID=1465823 RepID=UPI00030BCDE1|nr:DUF4197 domain-containing protein [Noviherbaspirillum massiliense]